MFNVFSAILADFPNKKAAPKDGFAKNLSSLIRITAQGASPEIQVVDKLLNVQQIETKIAIAVGDNFLRHGLIPGEVYPVYHPQ
jgi:hypothetical protein